MDYLGQASAATLGYIVDNQRGAKRAASLYQKHSKRQRMVSSSETRGRSRTRSTSSVAKYKPRGNSSMSVSVAGTKRRGRSLSSVRSITADAGANNVRAVAAKKKGKKVAKEGLKKHVKVPKKLRKQIKEVIAVKKNTAIGRYTDIKYFKITPTDSQVITMLGNTTDTLPNLFDPVWIQYTASVLFNGALVNATPTNSTANFFSARTLSVDVLKQSVTYRMMNNSARTLTVKIWDLSPKSRQYNLGYNPYTYWQGAFLAESSTSPYNPNKFAITPETLYANPKMTAMFRNMYSMDETIVNLEAGKEYVHTLRGPNMTYDFQKYWDTNAGTGVFSNQQKFIKHTMICVYNDITATTLATPGRFTDMVGASPYGLLVEQTTFTKIGMPEQAGFAWPAVTPVTGDQPLNQRYSAYAVQNWAGAQSGVVTKIEDENAQAPTTVGV